uniref:Si:dkey-66i24.7 n=1 Tax=Kryptolebias marmoratus TaxID=37003 RepID=A0A3Q3ALC6_KRYMA
MEVIETIVIPNTDVEGKETVVSNMETDKTKAFIWRLQATWHLVSTRLEMDQAFDQPVCKKKKLWELVAEKVNAKLRGSGVTGVTVRAYECDLKWRNMLATYRKNAERSKRLGAASVHWEFFRTMHEVLGKSREEIEAQRQAKISGTRVGKAMASKRFTPILPTPPAAGASASCAARPPQDVLQLYMELQERKLNMWAQQKALEERKIDAINNLAQAISSL